MVITGGSPLPLAPLDSQIAGAPISYGVPSNFSQVGGSKRRKKKKKTKRRRIRRTRGKRTRRCDCDDCGVCECDPCRCTKKRNKRRSRVRKKLASFRANLKK